MPVTTSGRAGGDELTNLALMALGGLFALSAVLRFAASVAAFLTGLPLPDGGPAAGLMVLADPLHPAAVFGTTQLNPLVYWVIVTLLVAAVVVVAWLAWRLVTGLRTPSAHTNTAVGLATTADLARAGSRRALVRRSATLRPSLVEGVPSDVGYLLGHARGRELWASVEDSMLVLGPPRSGKGLHLVINAVLDAPGAVVTTSTRPDTLAVTLAARQELGPVAVFDPQRLAGDLGQGLRWSPIRGCETPRRAMVRAAGLAKDTGIGGKGVENGGFWENTTKGAPQALLHAAALAGRTAKDLYVWSLSPAAAADAVAILRAHPAAAHGWGEGLEAMLTGEGTSRASVWIGVRQALSALADPDVLDAVSPGPDEHFDPENFLRERGTLYLLATGSGASASSALVAALIEDLTETARRLAARSPGQRLDPPLLLALDEIGNIAPLPSFRFLMGGDLGLLHRQGHPGRNLLSCRPARPVRPARREGRDHRFPHHRLRRDPVAATVPAPSPGHATGDHPHPALRAGTGPAALGPTHHRHPAALDPATRRRPAHYRPDRVRGRDRGRPRRLNRRARRCERDCVTGEAGRPCRGARRRWTGARPATPVRHR